jgi:repressor LexA
MLSDRQAKILQFLRDFAQENGYPPSIRQIGEAAEISSTSVVNYNLNILQREGFITRDRTISRGIRLTDETGQAPAESRFVSIPLLGVIAAGSPIDVPESSFHLEKIEIPRSMIPADKNVYALRVSGTSMIDALINDGDIIFLKTVTEVRNGDMVAAWLINEEATTLKRYFNQGDKIRLQPENSSLQPIFVKPENLQIQGKVVAVYRKVD